MNAIKKQQEAIQNLAREEWPAEEQPATGIQFFDGIDEDGEPILRNATPAEQADIMAAIEVTEPVYNVATARAGQVKKGVLIEWTRTTGREYSRDARRYITTTKQMTDRVVDVTWYADNSVEATTEGGATVTLTAAHGDVC